MMTSETFKEEVLTLATKVGVKPREIHIQSMKRKWASCSSKGRLTFDKKLLDEPDEVRVKVILHELLHLKYPNHGKMFKSLLDTYFKKELSHVNPS
ncbi:MAG TPA: M48 family metallopeptidase [Treponemataceae bacterium]|jgi:predicted metal-dependent hydrolase|nr:M48 family metallopeptidase [Treponemataceae bacterium]